MHIPNIAIRELKRGKIGVLPTDTIYGVLGQALNKKTVERIYRVRRRNPQKPFIILISKISDLELFGIKIDAKQKKILRKLWPGAVSVVLNCLNKKFVYLHRGTKTLAFRLPESLWLRKLLSQTGPLVAPSANPEGLDPARSISEAQDYFGQYVDIYVDVGRLKGKASTLVFFNDSGLQIKRLGSVSRRAIETASK